MIQKTIDLSFGHQVAFTHDAFAPSNRTLIDLLESQDGPARALVFVERALAEVTPSLLTGISSYAEAHRDLLQLAAAPFLTAGGEACKNDFSRVEEIWRQVHDAGLDRHSYILIIGGGALLDMVGFAASTAHRGIRQIRFPTTTLSQGDGGVGVKNAVNYFGKKNWIGTFSVPHAVINDLDFLDTLPETDRKAGIIEAIKVALIQDKQFFEAIETAAPLLSQLDPDSLKNLVRRSAELHVEHIATSGDPFEMGSARPLDFGHWVAHKLEQLSDFRIGHGDAVSIGIAIDLLYSVEIGLLPQATCERILRLIQELGFPAFCPELTSTGPSGDLAILEGLEEFREHLGGQLTITLVPEIGRKTEVNTMNTTAIRSALETLRSRAQATHQPT